MMKVLFEKVPFPVSGRIDIENETQLTNVLVAVQQAIQNYIFPKVSPAGYKNLANENTPVNEIFNGPLLKKGWIPTASLGVKKDLIHGSELVPVIESVAGVIS